MFRLPVRLLGSAFRPVGYLLLDLLPWLVNAAVSWLATRLGASSRRRLPCHDCPFHPPAPADDPPRPSSTAPLAFLAVAVAAMTVGCVPASPYVAADRATFDAVASEYSAYVAADERLDDQQKTRRQRTVDTWRLRLEKAESPGSR